MFIAHYLPIHYESDSTFHMSSMRCTLCVRPCILAHSKRINQSHWPFRSNFRFLLLLSTSSFHWLFFYVSNIKHFRLSKLLLSIYTCFESSAFSAALIIKSALDLRTEQHNSLQRTKRINEVRERERKSTANSLTKSQSQIIFVFHVFIWIFGYSEQSP